MVSRYNNKNELTFESSVEEHYEVFNIVVSGYKLADTRYKLDTSWSRYMHTQSSVSINLVKLRQLWIVTTLLRLYLIPNGTSFGAKEVPDQRHIAALLCFLKYKYYCNVHRYIWLDIHMKVNKINTFSHTSKK